MNRPLKLAMVGEFRLLPILPSRPVPVKRFQNKPLSEYPTPYRHCWLVMLNIPLKVTDSKSITLSIGFYIINWTESAREYSKNGGYSENVTPVQSQLRVVIYHNNKIETSDVLTTGTVPFEIINGVRRIGGKM